MPDSIISTLDGTGLSFLRQFCINSSWVLVRTDVSKRSELLSGDWIKGNELESRGKVYSIPIHINTSYH